MAEKHNLWSELAKNKSYFPPTLLTHQNNLVVRVVCKLIKTMISHKISIYSDERSLQF
jgi:hypothetical protein